MFPLTEAKEYADCENVAQGMHIVFHAGVVITGLNCGDGVGEFLRMALAFKQMVTNAI